MNAALARIADPNAAATFEACKLDWDEAERPRHRDRLALIRKLLELRHRHLDPHVAKFSAAGRYRVEHGLLWLRWQVPAGDAWVVQANFSAQAIDTEVPPCPAYAAGVVGGRIESGGVVAGWVGSHPRHVFS